MYWRRPNNENKQHFEYRIVSYRTIPPPYLFSPALPFCYPARPFCYPARTFLVLPPAPFVVPPVPFVITLVPFVIPPVPFSIAAGEQDTMFIVRMSYVELYNNRFRNLLDGGGAATADGGSGGDAGEAVGFGSSVGSGRGSWRGIEAADGEVGCGVAWSGVVCVVFEKTIRISKAEPNHNRDGNQTAFHAMMNMSPVE